jgi:AraC-like DNA-binding protein
VSYQEWSPGPELADRVACFWTSGIGPSSGSQEEPGGSVLLRRILPDGCMDIIWGPDGVQVAGPDTHAHLAPVRPDARYVAVRFLPGGAGTVFGVPAEALTDLRLPLSDLWNGHLPWPEAPTSIDDLAGFREVVAHRLDTGGPVADPSVPAMRRALAAGTPVTQVARDLGLSERTLRRRSRAAFGYGPKTLQRILRFQQALDHARRGADLAWVAHECGYTDQAHFAGEVKDLAGVPVTRLR